jgi:IS5 family transposase
MLTPGNVSDIKAAPALLERAGRMRYLLGDKAYDVDSLRRSIREAGAISVIPDAATGSGPYVATNSDTAAATPSRTLSVA